MNVLLDSFWRAVLYCLRPRVIALSFLPLVLMVGLSLGLGYFYWDAALLMVRQWLDASELVGSISSWLQSVGLGNLKSVLEPVIVVFAVTPLIVVLSLLIVSLLMTPAMISLVAEKRFPGLERKRGGSLIVSVSWSLLSTALALVAMLVSMPLWLIPPLILILPPLIWGWLTYRVMAFDALADYASSEERREIFLRHRLPLLCIGVFCGYLSAAPSLIWASGAVLLTAFVVLVPIAVWIYTLVFALSSLWFGHYCLAALQALRAERATVMPVPADLTVTAMNPLNPPLNHEPDARQPTLN